MINTQKEEIIQGYSSIEEFTKDGFKMLTEAIRNSNALPTGRDWNFYSTHTSFVEHMNNRGNQILNSINFELRKYEIDGNIKSRTMDDKIELIVEANDIILERAANNIDVMNGIKKDYVDPVVIQTVSAELPVNGSWNRMNKANFSVSSSMSIDSPTNNLKSITLITGKNILRPQKFFKDKIDNTNKYPWMPRIKEKPNSIKPLAIFLEETENGEEYSHPYEFELERFEPNLEDLKETVPKEPKALSETPLIEVTTEEQLNDLLNDLYKQKEFAVDLEHHSYRSFMGITCLMQISTNEKDYIIDTLKLRDKLHILNEVFTKPSIVKIFHGADSDILWLQRDMSLYVVNMFDTHQAARQLEYSGRSLAFLLKKFCDFMPNKHFQLADWRIRPLPDELKTYAREDTHYLIYIYHKMKNELLKKGNGSDKILRSVIKNSTEICKRRYLKPILKEDSYLDFYRKCKRLFDNRQLFALKELYKWRDNISREEDESTGYVLPNHMLLQISEALPREMQGILACCNPIPPLVRANLLELHKIILLAREQSVEKPILKEDNRGRGSIMQFSKVNVDSPLHCPHDLTKSGEFCDDLETLLNSPIRNNRKVNHNIEKLHSDISVFDAFDEVENKIENDTIKKLKNLKFLGPYERYKLVKPFIQAEEEKVKALAEKSEIKSETTGSGLNAPNMIVEEVNLSKPVKPEETVTLEETVSTTVSHNENAESIATLHKHFVNLVKQIPQILPSHRQPQNLIELGGSRKRKFVEEYDEAYHDQVDLQTPQPNFYRRNLKRKFNQADFDNGDMTQIGRKKFKKGPPQNKPVQNKNKNNTKNRQTQNKQKKNNQQQQKQNKQKRNNQQNFSNVDGGQQIGNTSQKQNNNKSKRGRNRRKNKNTQPKQEQKFQPFDYSSVDYKQFQGGAGSAFQNKNFKAKYRGKGNLKKFKGTSNNKSLSYGTGNKGRLANFNVKKSM